MDTNVTIPVGGADLHGDLVVPREPLGIVLFAHGSGSSRHSPRNRFVADFLNGMGLGTFLFDLLTSEEDAIDARTAEYRFDIALLAERLDAVAVWTHRHPLLNGLPIGFFGSSTGGGAALVAAARRPANVCAIVSRGGRPDLAGAMLAKVEAPTLLIVGERDPEVIELNRQAMARMKCTVDLEIVPGATHLFQEPGTLAQVARLASEWFVAKCAPVNQSYAAHREVGTGH